MYADDCDVLFFFNDTATTEIYTLSLHDALPICFGSEGCVEPSFDIGVLACDRMAEIEELTGQGLRGIGRAHV